MNVLQALQAKYEREIDDLKQALETMTVLQRTGQDPVCVIDCLCLCCVWYIAVDLLSALLLSNIVLLSL